MGATPQAARAHFRVLSARCPVPFCTTCADLYGVCVCVWTRIHMLVALNQSRSRCSLRGLSELQATERHCAITAPAAARHAAVATARAWSWHGTQRRWTLPAAGQRLLDAHPWPLLGARGPSGTVITAAGSKFAQFQLCLGETTTPPHPGSACQSTRMGQDCRSAKRRRAKASRA